MLDGPSRRVRRIGRTMLHGRHPENRDAGKLIGFRDASDIIERWHRTIASAGLRTHRPDDRERMASEFWPY